LKREIRRPGPRDDYPISSVNPEESLALVSDSAQALDGIMAYSTRLGGHSPRPFDSLNFSVREGDSEKNVRLNLEVFGSELGILPESMIFCRQVHSDKTAIVDHRPSERPVADAVICSTPGLFPVIMTADCLPILILDPVSKVAAGIHAGWKGTVLRITR
jgi:copper oxidase (laccase) domain-containing protein